MYRFAVLPYANALPLTNFIEQICPQAELIERKPCQMLRELDAGCVDAALLSVVDFFSSSGLEMIDGLGIAADGEVQSVLLQCQRPLEQVEKVALDPESRTANTLARLLFAKHFSGKHKVRFVDAGQKAEAVVVIGDRALCARRAFKCYDLAEQWQAMTGLGFVFAVWAYRLDHPDPQSLWRILRLAKEVGTRHKNYLAKLGAERLGLSLSRTSYYLNSCVRYELGATELAGMKLFAELLNDCRLVGGPKAQSVEAKVLEEIAK